MLYTVAKDRPLSFLNHHLRIGNSLIGAWMKDLGALPDLKKRKKVKTPGGISFFESELKKKLPVVVGQVVKLLQTPSDKVEQIREKERIYEKIREVLCPFKEAANVWTSVYFGNEVKAGDYEGKLLLKLSGTPTVWESEVRSQPWFVKAQEIAREKHFFHWELEFPEVFYRETGQRKENPGFDAVIGNPPYGVFVRRAKGRQADFLIYQEVEPKEFQYLCERFTHSAEYAPNTFALFSELNFTLLRDSGYHGFIYPSTITYNHYFRKLRTFITTESRLTSIVEISRVFTQVETGGNAIVTWQKGAQSSQSVRVGRVHTPKELHRATFNTVIQSAFLASGETKWIATPEVLSITQKLTQDSVLLKYMGQLYQGVCTGHNKRWLTMSKTSKLARAVLRGRDISRYTTTWNGVYLLFDKDKMWSNTNEDLLQSKPKLLFRQTSDSLVVSMDSESRFLIDSLYMLRPINPGSTMYLLSVLNSRLLNFYYQIECPEERRTFAQVKITNLETLPIRRIAFTTPKDEREQLVTDGERLYFEALARIGLKSENGG